VLRLPIATLIALAALPAAAAQGLSGTDAGMRVGLQVWGMPACGQPHVEVTTPAEYAFAHGDANFGDSVPLAWADETRCMIVINRDLAHIEIRTAAKRCHVIVHEWGHLTGHEHSDNPRSVMYGEDLVAESRVRRHGRVFWRAANPFKPCAHMTRPGTRVG
jgi:hypothetical protein